MASKSSFGLARNGWLVESSLSLLMLAMTKSTRRTRSLPKNNGRAGAGYGCLGLSKELSLGANGTLILRGDWSYRSETFNDAYNTPLLKTDSGFAGRQRALA